MLTLVPFGRPRLRPCFPLDASFVKAVFSFSAFAFLLEGLPTVGLGKRYTRESTYNPNFKYELRLGHGLGCRYAYEKYIPIVTLIKSNINYSTPPYENNNMTRWNLKIGKNKIIKTPQLTYNDNKQ